MNKIIDDIFNNWDIDAKKEDVARYYFQTSDVENVLNGQKPIVIGRKGTGKTALFEYIKTKVGYKNFVSATSFSGFPINNLLKMRDGGFETGSDYISLWRFVIFKELCSLLATNENLDSVEAVALKKAFPPFADIKIRQAFKLGDSFSLKILDYLQIEDRSKSLPSINDLWMEKIDPMASASRGCIDSSNYYILFDSLDDNFRDSYYKDDIDLERNNYLSCMAGLIKAAIDIRSYFSSLKKNVFPIIFLSSDVFNLIKDRDKNKWRYSIKYLEWDQDELKAFLAHRIKASSGERGSVGALDFDREWNRVFDSEKLIVSSNRVPTFDYITQRTLFRPRDYITYVKDCCEVASRRNFSIIRAGVILNTEGWYSEYFWQEMVDEITPIIGCVDKIFNVIEKIRKLSFTIDDFVAVLDDHIRIKLIKESELIFSPHQILAILYDYSAIGNIYQGERIFKYRRHTTSFDYSLPIVVHRGFDVVLGINPRARRQRERVVRRDSWIANQGMFDFQDVDGIDVASE